KKTKDRKFIVGQRVTINTGSKYISSVKGYFGTIRSVVDKERFLVETSDGLLSVHKNRLRPA
ncbi:MAG TPA: hypothetical protein VJC20_00695, partial [Candidatus Paceibacterota bacterium]